MSSLQFSIPLITNTLSSPLSSTLPNPHTRHYTCGTGPHVTPSSIRLHRQHPCLRATAQDVLINGRVSGAGATAEEQILPAELQRESMPKHVAVIMDGNRRWASLRGLPTGAGHEAGLRALRRLVELCCMWGIRVLTVFAFSSDNWTRPSVEVEFLMSLFERGLNEDLESFAREGIQVSVIGDSSKLPNPLQKLITDVEEMTKNNSRLQLIVAASYSGQYDIVQACQNIALKVRDGLIEPKDINESLIERELETNCTDFPYPDLLIRTSGELRVSNFLLWQMAYTELFFVQSFWPDFGESEFLEALRSFQKRRRRYGGP